MRDFVYSSMLRAWYSLGPDQQGSALAVGWTVAAVLAAHLLYNFAQAASYQRQCAEVKQNLHAIQIAVERYSADHPQSYYPRDLELLQKDGYMPEFPRNPFTGQPMRCIEVPQVPPGEFRQLHQPPEEATPGDFFYYMRFDKSGPAATGGWPTGYSLGAYF